jgi:hypothetical protein
MTVGTSTPDRRAISPIGSGWKPCSLSSETERMRAFTGSWVSTGRVAVVVMGVRLGFETYGCTAPVRMTSPATGL